MQEEVLRQKIQKKIKQTKVLIAEYKELTQPVEPIVPLVEFPEWITSITKVLLKPPYARPKKSLKTWNAF